MAELEDSDDDDFLKNMNLKLSKKAESIIKPVIQNEI